VSAPDEIVLSANRTSLLAIRAAEGAEPGTTSLTLSYEVSNLLLEPGKGLPYELVLQVEVVAAEE
jgi:hypothetical protein